MGYTVTRATVKLVFEGTSLAGAEVLCKSTSLGSYFELAELKSDPTAARTLIREFAEHVLDSWNLEEEDGSAIPCTEAGLLSLDPTTVMAIIEAWADGLGGVRGPLDDSSNSTDT